MKKGKVIKLKKHARIKPILPTGTLNYEDSEEVIKQVCSPISDEVKAELKRRREIILKTRK